LILDIGEGMQTRSKDNTIVEYFNICDIPIRISIPEDKVTAKLIKIKKSLKNKSSKSIMNKIKNKDS
jgi:hypothetical protein